MIFIPAVPLKLQPMLPLQAPVKPFALTRLDREGSTGVSAFLLPAPERLDRSPSRGSHQPPRL